MVIMSCNDTTCLQPQVHVLIQRHNSKINVLECKTSSIDEWTLEWATVSFDLPYIYQSISLLQSIHPPSIHLSIHHQFINPSIYPPSIYQSIYLSTINLSIHLSIHHQSINPSIHHLLSTHYLIMLINPLIQSSIH